MAHTHQEHAGSCAVRAQDQERDAQIALAVGAPDETGAIYDQIRSRLHYTASEPDAWLLPEERPAARGRPHGAHGVPGVYISRDAPRRMLMFFSCLSRFSCWPSADGFCSCVFLSGCFPVQ